MLNQMTGSVTTLIFHEPSLLPMPAQLPYIKTRHMRRRRRKYRHADDAITQIDADAEAMGAGSDPDHADLRAIPYDLDKSSLFQKHIARRERQHCAPILSWIATRSERR
ncbi:MAG: hypothetical protein WCF20_12140 [Methylovirgula sp.]